MEITMQKTDAVSGLLTVNVEENDYKQKVTEELKRIGRTHQIPGFRKGHISVADLQRRFGRQVTSDIINQVVYEGVMKYIEDNKLNVLGQPMPVEVKALDLKNQKDFTFEYELALAPELDIKLDKDEHIPYYDIEVSDAMIEEQDKALRKRFGAQVPGEEFEPDALVKGALMELNADGTVKEDGDAIQVTSAIVAPFYFKSKEEAAKFEGKKVGDKVVFNPRKSCDGDIAELSSMLNISKERTAEVQGDFELAISEIIVVRPAELGEEFYTQVFGSGKVNNEEEYRAAVKDMIARELKGNSEMIFRFAARKYFTEKYGNMELPAAILKKWLISRNENLNEENIDKEYEGMEADLRWQLIKERIAELTNVKIEEADLMEMAKSIASRQLAQYGMTNMDDETVTSFAKNILADKNYRPRIVEQVGDIKLFEAIANAVTLDKETVSFDRFKEIAANM
ncbi:MAG: trigger factor [Muribaculaceae bacterium]|nr:trigger factor [Muribaculaceae bacterium]